MSDWTALTKTWKEARDKQERALLFTLIDVVGSSYRKVGAHMLATSGGAVAGSVSAGCIEADLMARMEELFEGTLPQVLSYTNINEDEFALNRGCNGDICIYVEELDAVSANSLSVFEQAKSSRSPQVHALEVKDLRLAGGSRLFVERIQPPLRVVIFGNQRDTEPLSKLVSSIDAEVSTFKKSQIEELASVEPDARTAVVIMSHDFERDNDALRVVAAKPFPYVGVMGPKYRTEEMLKLCASPILASLRYPIGINIAAEGSNEIAVSIIAEIIQTFAKGPQRIATVVLAAGEASRFGAPKQLEKWNGESFVRRITKQALLTAQSSETLIVLGAYAEQVVDELAGLRVKTLINADWQLGMGGSISAAARWLHEQNFDGAVFVACDQVLVESKHIATLIRSAQNATIAAAAYGDTFGIPAYFNKSHFAELEAIEATAGAKAVITKHRTDASFVEMQEAATDIDTQEQLKKSSNTGEIVRGLSYQT